MGTQEPPRPIRQEEGYEGLQELFDANDDCAGTVFQGDEQGLTDNVTVVVPSAIWDIWLRYINEHVVLSELLTELVSLDDSGMPRYARTSSSGDWYCTICRVNLVRNHIRCINPKCAARKAELLLGITQA